MLVIVKQILRRALPLCCCKSSLSTFYHVVVRALEGATQFMLHYVKKFSKQHKVEGATNGMERYRLEELVDSLE